MLLRTGAQNRRPDLRSFALFASLLTFATTGCNVVNSASSNAQSSAALKAAAAPAATRVRPGKSTPFFAPGTTVAARPADPARSASGADAIDPFGSVMTVQPPSASVPSGGTQQLTAVVNGVVDTNVTWQVSAGQISATGLYTAPFGGSASFYLTATATSISDPTQFAMALLQVTPAPVGQISITPQSATLQSGGTQQFSASLTGTSNTAIVWSMSPQLGTLSTSGFYTAPTGNTTNLQVSIVATSATSPGSSATATATVLAPSAVKVSISPASLTVLSGATGQLNATVTGTSNVAVTWSSSVGTVSAGLYTAPVTSVQETATVTATSVADPTQKAAATIAVTPQGSTGAGVLPGFFGMHVNQMTSPWPTVPFASYRTLNSDYIKWADINTADQVYNWRDFDKWMGRAEAGGQDIMYTLFTTPTWASTRGRDSRNPNYHCVYWNISGPGACDPPNDLNADGTGTDQHWKDFITAVMNHVGPGRIKYWEVWNEYNNNVEWTGTQAQMLRLAKDAYTIIKSMDSNALVTSPSVSSAMFSVDNWVTPYLAAGGGDYADIIAIHGYVHLPSNICPYSCPDPQIVAAILDKARAAMLASGQQNKPLFDTEGSWGEGTQMHDPDMQTAFTARYYLIQAAGTPYSKGFDKFYWYGWDFPHSGQFYALNGTGLNTSGTAYQQLYNWLVGATQSGCSPQGTQWTCPMTRTGYQAEAIWDSSQTCSQGNCSTTNVTVPSTYTQYQDLDGNVTAISNNAVPVGLKPILLESGNPPSQ